MKFEEYIYLNEKVEKIGNKWYVVHCSGPDKGKPINSSKKGFASKEEAEKMHRAVQASKYAG